jgi:hypothetical protein
MQIVVFAAEWSGGGSKGLIPRSGYDAIRLIIV